MAYWLRINNRSDMEPEFTMYTKDDCSFCVAAKKVLNMMGKSYIELTSVQIPDLPTVVAELWKSKGVDKPTVPLIVVTSTNEVIGGYDDLLVHLTQV